MDPHKETFEVWNKVAQLYEDKFMDLPLYNDGYDKLCELLPHRAEVLEVGCGPGNIAKYILSRRPDVKWYGIDVASGMVDLARKNNPLGSFEVLDARRIDTLNRKFDIIVCGFCLPYLSQEDSRTFLADAKQLLNKDGIIYLSFVEGDPGQSGYQTSTSGHRIFFYYYQIANIEQLLLNLGLKPVYSDGINYTNNAGNGEVHRVVICKDSEH